MPSRMARFGRWIVTAASMTAVVSCNEQRLPSGIVPDDIPPTASIESSVDTVDINQGLQFTINVTDNVGLKTVSIAVTGAVVFSFDTTFTAPVLSFTETFDITIAAGAAGGPISISLTVSDGAGNENSATRSIAVFDPIPPAQTLLAPAPGTAFGAGDVATVIVRSTDPSGVVLVGARLFVNDALGNPVTISADTSGPFATPQFGRTDTLSLAIPDTLDPGTYLIGTFAVDAAGNQGSGTPVNVGVIDLQGPTGVFVSPPVDSMVVAGDSVLVSFRAQDLTGVDSVRLRGIVVRGDSALGTAVTVVRFLPKVANAGGATDSTIRRYLLPDVSDSTPERVTLEATVYDVGGNSSRITSTIQVVRGPFVRVAAPANGSAQAVGEPLAIDITARSPNTVEYAGFIATGVVSGADSIQFPGAPDDSVLAMLSLAVPTTADLGTINIVPFAVDGIGKRFLGAPISVTLTDGVPPTISFVQPAAGTLVRVGDSVRVAVQVQDNRGVTNLSLVGVAHRGDPNLGTNTVVTRLIPKGVTLNQATADTIITRDLLSDPADQTAETVYIVVTARDSTGNSAKDSVQIEMVVGPALTIVAPGDSSIAAPGKDMSIVIRGVAATGIGKLGYFTSGTLVAGDTVVLPTTDPQVSDTTLTFVLSVPAATPLGFFDIHPFGTDSIGNAGTGSSITVELVASAGVGDTTPPLVTSSLDLRSEVDDSVLVRAIDVGGITRVGFVVTDLAGTATLSGDSADFGGTSTDISRTFALGLDTVTTFPLQVVVTVFGIDSVGNRGELSRTGNPVASGAKDTVTIVAGRTVPLPMGGTIIDAIYNRNLNEVYMTNVDLEHLEVFDVASISFGSPVPVGSRPWGVALWPADTLGANDNRVVVANSGGTDLSIVDVATRREIDRHALPNFIIQAVTTERDEETGVIQIKITEHDFSDRPQYLGTTCRTAGGTACHPDSIYAVYSTTPTIDQGEFPRRGSIRWENIGTTPDPESHFFWEQAVVPPDPSFDTLQVIVDRGPGSQETILAAACGIMVDIEQLVFRDTTYVRNSGNFTHALIGEGGVISEGFARAVGYTGNDSVSTRVCSGEITVGDSTFSLPDGPENRDFGVTPGIRVRDFISNTATSVNSIGINFNGLTNLIRTTDSVYVLNEFLRLKGLIAVGGANAGMDLNFDHAFEAGVGGTPGTFGGTADSTNRVVFLASDNPVIEVFDTFFFSRVATVPIKNPIVGPLRVARLASGDQLIIGVTEEGVVMVQLPQVDNPFPVSGMGNRRSVNIRRR